MISNVALAAEVVRKTIGSGTGDDGVGLSSFNGVDDPPPPTQAPDENHPACPTPTSIGPRRDADNIVGPTPDTVSIDLDGTMRCIYRVREISHIHPPSGASRVSG